METTLFESSEFYQRRYRNFSTLIILPVLAIVIGLLALSLIGHRELTVKATGEVTPVAVISRVQSTSDAPILVNNLEENKEVVKGEKLLVYDDLQSRTQLESLSKQEQQVLDQKDALETLRAGLNDDSVQFDVPDSFGYSDTLTDFREQVRSITLETQQANESAQSQNQSVAAAHAAIETQIAQTQARLDDYRQMKEATIRGDAKLPDDNELTGLYTAYRSDRTSTPKEQRSGVQSQFVSSVETTIQQLSDTHASLMTQRSSAGGTTGLTLTASSRISALRSEFLLNADKEMTQLSSSLLDIQTNTTLAEAQQERNTVEAGESGVLHVSQGSLGVDMVAAGTVVAEIYPSLVEGQKVEITTFIPVADIVGLEKGQTMRMRSAQRTEQPLVLEGTVDEIAASPTRTENGNFYEVNATVAVTEETAERVRYGFEGQTVIVTGQKTFFAYYRDKILKR